MKRLLAILLTAVLVLSVISTEAFVLNTEAATSGITGDCTWKIDGNVLIISGDGEMEDYSIDTEWNSTAPYVEYYFSKVIIENGVRNIGECAFYNCYNITSIEMASSVTSIGELAFTKCSGLRNVELSNNVTSIGQGAFASSGLTSVEIPDGVKSIEHHTFYNTTRLVNISLSSDVTYVGENAFDKCNNLTNVWYRGSELDKSRANINIESGNACLLDVTWKYTFCKGEHIFENACDTTCDCGYERTITHAYQQKIDHEYHYLECTICGAKTENERHLFENACDKMCDCGYERTITHSYLQQYDITNHWDECGVCGDKQNIEEHAYQQEKNATNHWDECSVCHDKKNTELHIYDNDCDEYCNECYFKRIPPLTLSFLYSGNAVVMDCLDTVTTVEIPKIVTNDENGEKYRIIGIEYGAFQDCTNLESVSIPTSVTWIEECAFKNCTSLVTMNIPDSVTRIEESAFENCNKLESVTIGENVVNIDYSAFRGCDSLTEIIVNKLNQKYTSVDGVLFDESKTELIVYPKGKIDECYAVLDGVKTIGDYAFYNCDKLTEVIIPDSVTTICDSAFRGCIKLDTIVLPSSLYELGNAVFDNCKSLKQIEIPDNVEQMGTSLFSGCYSLETLIIPNVRTWHSVENRYLNNFGSFFGVTSNNHLQNGASIPKTLKKVEITNATSIAGYAFYGCDSIESIIINDEVTSIGQYAFQECNGLKTITLPFVGASSFNTTQNTRFGYIFGAQTMIPSSLEEVVITNTTSIDDYAFYNISTIKTLRITKDIVSVGEGAFEGCSGLSDVYYSGTKLEADDIAVGLSNECLKNATWHYNNCVEHRYSYECDDVCDVCGETRIASEHSYENSCDATCDCGYIRTITHNHQPDYDAQNHYLKCAVCGDKINYERHVFENDCDTTCGCGYVRTITHNYP